MKNPHIEAKVLYATENVEFQGSNNPHKGDAFIPTGMMPCFGFRLVTPRVSDYEAYQKAYWVYRPNLVVDQTEIPLAKDAKIGTCVRLSSVLRWLKEYHQQEAKIEIVNKVRRSIE